MLLLLLLNWGNTGRMERKMGTTVVHCGYMGFIIGIMEKNMETIIFRKMETTISEWQGPVRLIVLDPGFIIGTHWGNIGVIMGGYWL